MRKISLRQAYTKHESAHVATKAPPTDTSKTLAMLTRQIDRFDTQLKRHGTSIGMTTKKCHKHVTTKPMAYCWTHGLTFNMEHDSKTCSYKQTNHQEEATADNMLGRCNRIQCHCQEGQLWKAPQNSNWAQQNNNRR